MIRLLSQFLLIQATAFAAFGQSAPTSISFEVASVKPHQGPLTQIFGYSSSGSRVTLTGYPPIGLLMEAYNLKYYEQVSFAASVQRDDIYYDIVAKAPGTGAPTRAEFRKMLQTLLAERFDLTIHRELKEMPVYALVVGKRGPKFKASAIDASFAAHYGVKGRNQTVTASKYTIPLLARAIQDSFAADRPVVDQTGLTGTYDIKLEATPEFRSNRDADLADISIFNAVQEQLGLRLEPQKAMLEVIVVDRFHKPSAN